ncbi:MAG: diguanylate cyclase [Deltaproteobacteria bacterium]|nr:diguanylate cyclase [Deltaproteobacteria bacterium]
MKERHEVGAKAVNRYFLILAAILTVGIVASLGWNIYQLKLSILNIARRSAEVSHDKDILYRIWVAKQGGVYAPLSETTTPSNPYLKVPGRDVKTTEGLFLTLINPAYMNRQVNEMAGEMGSLRGHITSLNPIRPENSPDPWERESLELFEGGVKETASLEKISGREFFRFMRPLVTEKTCLQCHASQGYKEGDIRGGISVSIPMEPLRAIEKKRGNQLALAHGFLWIIGIIGIGTGTRRLRIQTLRLEKAEESVLMLAITDQLTGLHNRRGFLTLAEQQLKLADRTKKRLLLFFADLDGIKWINDTLGHKEGDNALTEAAAILKETFRASDIIARIGGDEFVILAIDIEELDAETHMARLQDQTEMHNGQKNRSYRISLSVGCSCYDPGNPCSIDELIGQADKRMYEQKRSKRSCVS